MLDVNCFIVLDVAPFGARCLFILIAARLCLFLPAAALVIIYCMQMWKRKTAAGRALLSAVGLLGVMAPPLGPDATLHRANRTEQLFLFRFN